MRIKFMHYSAFDEAAKQVTAETKALKKSFKDEEKQRKLTETKKVKHCRS